MNRNQPKMEKKTSEKTKEQMEDRVFHKMLCWLAAAAVIEMVILLINRFYIHTRVSELDSIMRINQLLKIAPIVGVVLFVLCLFWIWTRRRNHPEKEGILPMVLGASFLLLGICAFLIQRFGASSVNLLLGMVPALGILMMIYYLFHREFFACSVLSGLGLLGLWIFRKGGTEYRGLYYGFFALVLVLALVGIFLSRTLKKQNGVLQIKGRAVRVLLPSAAYLAFYLTCGVVALVLLAPLVFGAAVAYYAIWAMAAWFFILAVYFTARLM